MTNCNEINIEAERLKSIFGKCYNLKALDLRDVVDLIESVNACSNGQFELKTINGESLFGSGNIIVTADVDGTETKIQQGSGILISGSGSIGSPYVITSQVDPADGSETKINQGSNISIGGTGTSSDPYVINAIMPSSEAQVNPDWSAISGPAEILNKPEIPLAQVNVDWNAVSGITMILNKPNTLNTNLGYVQSEFGGEITSSNGTSATIPLVSNEFPGLVSKEMLEALGNDLNNIKLEFEISMPINETNEGFATSINEREFIEITGNQIPTFKAIKIDGEDSKIFYVEILGRGKGGYGVDGYQLSSEEVRFTSFNLTGGNIEDLPGTQIIDLGINSTDVVSVINSRIPNLIIQGQEDGYVLIKGTFNGTIYKEYLWIGEGGIYGGEIGASQASYSNLKELTIESVGRATSTSSGTVKTNLTVEDPVVYLKETSDLLLNEKEDKANKQNSLTVDGTGIKYPTVDSVVGGLATKANISGQIFTGAISATNISGTNTGDETTLSIQTKRPLKTLDGVSIEGVGDIITPTKAHALTHELGGTDVIQGENLSVNVIPPINNYSPVTSTLKGHLQGIDQTLGSVQSTLVSGTTIKTIEWQSILGSGNIDITKVDVGLANVPNTDFTAAVAANTAKTTNQTHTGDATGSTALTLATVNSNVGTFGNASNSTTQTVNAKGLTTEISNVPIQIAESQVTGLVSDLAGKQNSLGFTPENRANKQNSLTEDWTGIKYPTVDSVVEGLATKVDKVAGKSLISDSEITRLSSVQTGATANSTDAQLRDRTTHTGEQAISTVTGLQTELDGKQSSLGFTPENIVNKVTSIGASPTNINYPSELAVKTYADNLVVGMLNDRGSWDASVNVFPTTGGSGTSGAIRKGDMWYVSVAGVLGGKAVNIGDSFRALVNNPAQVAGNWSVLEANVGYVPANDANVVHLTGNETIAGIKTFNETPIINKLVTVTNKGQYYDLLKNGVGSTRVVDQVNVWNGSAYVTSDNGIFSGPSAGQYNTGSNIGSISGYFAGQNNTGSTIGSISGPSTGQYNTGSNIGSISGYLAGQNNTGSAIGIFSGFLAGQYNEGSNNIIGYNSHSSFLDNVSGTKTVSSIDIATERITITAHGFGSNNSYVNLKYTTTETAIGGLANNNIYQVQIIDANTIFFRVNNLSSQGSGTHTFTPQFKYDNVNIFGNSVNPTASNQTIIGNSSSTQFIAYGKHLVNTTTDNGIDQLQVNGTISATPATLSNQVVIKSQLDLKADLSSPSFTGTPTAPTATLGTNTTQLATTAFVNGGLATKENAFSKNTAFNKNFGTSAGTVAEGNDSRLSDSRTPTAGSTNYIQNQNASAQSANMWISGGIRAGGGNGFSIGAMPNGASLFTYGAGDLELLNANTTTPGGPFSLIWATDRKLRFSNGASGLDVFKLDMANGGAATFASTVTATLFNGSATLTGTPTAPTAAPGTNTTQIATTAFVAGGLATKENTFSKNTAFNKNFGTTSGTVVEGGTLGSNAYSSTAYLPLTGGTLTGVRPITFSPLDGSMTIRASAGGGWAIGSFLEGSSGVSFGGFGAFGTNDALGYYYIGQYGSEAFKLLPTGAATFTSSVTASPATLDSQLATLGQVNNAINTIALTPGPKGDKGDVGSQGIQGIQGIQGEIGLRGIQGEQGPIGFTGSKGDKGETGVSGLKGDQGVQGIQGIKGDQGIQGIAGIDGAKGDIGITGNTGPKGDTGFTGLKGDKGDKGNDGTGVTIKGELPNSSSLPGSGTAGDAYLITGNLWVWNGTSWANVGTIQGPQGIQGTQGPSGNTGLTGNTGSKGDQGIQGFTGLKGDIGLTGAKGDAGIAGTNGTNGVKGDKGDTGEQGLIGLTGSQGMQGPQGIKGDTGAQGIQGPQGNQGVKGDTGSFIGDYATINNPPIIPTNNNQLINGVNYSTKSYVDSQDSQILINAENKAKLLDNQLIIGGRNYYKNSSVINAYDGSTIVKTSSGLNITGFSGALATVRWDDSFPDVTNTYTFSFEAYSNVDGAPFLLQVNDVTIDNVAMTLSFKKYSYTFTPAGNGNNFIDFQDLQGFNYYFKNVKLEKGNKATDWSPAVEDVQNAIDTKVNKVSGKSLLSDNEITRLAGVTNQDISNKVDKVTGKSLIADTEITRLSTVTNQDISGKENLSNKTSDIAGNKTSTDKYVTAKGVADYVAASGSSSSGTYTPTVSIVNNCSAISVSKANYIVVGNIVMVNIRLSLTTSFANSNAEFAIETPTQAVSATIVGTGSVYNYVSGSPAGSISSLTNNTNIVNVTYSQAVRSSSGQTDVNINFSYSK